MRLGFGLCFVRIGWVLIFLCGLAQRPNKSILKVIREFVHFMLWSNLLSIIMAEENCVGGIFLMEKVTNTLIFSLFLYLGLFETSCTPTCRETQDCKRRIYCSEGVCKEGCTKDSDCGGGESCGGQGKCLTGGRRRGKARRIDDGNTTSDGNTVGAGSCDSLCQKTAACFAAGEGKAICLQECQAARSLLGSAADAILKKCDVLPERTVARI